MRRFLVLAFVSVVGLVGCGGGSSSVATDAGSGTEATFGPVTTRAVGPIKAPVTMLGAYSTVTGVVGANFTNLAVQLQAATNVDSEEIDNKQSMMGLSANNVPTLLDFGSNQMARIDSSTAGYGNDCGTTFFPTGEKIIATLIDSGLAFTMYSMNLDGSSKTPIAVPKSSFGASYNPTGTRIVYARSGEIYLSGATGGAETNLTNTASYEYAPKFSPNGQKIGYLRSESGAYEFWEMSSTGTGASQKFRVGSINSWDYAPNGDVYYTTTIGGTSYLLCNVATTGTTVTVLTTPDSISSVCVSPYGTKVAYQRLNSTPTLEVFDLLTNQSYVYRTLPGGVILNDWVAQPRKRTFVGASGAVMHTNAAGFLYGMSGNKFRSLLTFDSTDRANTQIDASPVGGFNPSNFVATITTAGQLNMLRYVNGYLMPKITVIDPATAATFAKGAVVTFDASDGTVASILPFVSAKAGAKPTRTKIGNLMELQGDFLGVFDKEGKKTAARVTSVTIDPKDGHVVSAR